MMSSILYTLEFILGYFVPAVVYVFLVPLTLFSGHFNGLNMMYLGELVLVCLLGIAGCFCAKRFYHALLQKKFERVRRYEFVLLVASTLSALYFVINLWGKGGLFLAFIAQILVNLHCIILYRRFLVCQRSSSNSMP